MPFSEYELTETTEYLMGPAETPGENCLQSYLSELIEARDTLNMALVLAGDINSGRAIIDRVKARVAAVAENVVNLSKGRSP